MNLRKICQLKIMSQLISVFNAQPSIVINYNLTDAGQLATCIYNNKNIVARALSKRVSNCIEIIEWKNKRKCDEKFDSFIEFLMQPYICSSTLFNYRTDTRR